MEVPELLTAREVAAKFGVNVKSVSRWAQKGWLTRIKTPGGANRFLLEEVTALWEHSLEIK